MFRARAIKHLASSGDEGKQAVKLLQEIAKKREQSLKSAARAYRLLQKDDAQIQKELEESVINLEAMGL